MEGATAEASLDGSKSLSCYTLLLGSTFSHDMSVTGLDRRICGPPVLPRDPYGVVTSHDASAAAMYCPIVAKPVLDGGPCSSSRPTAVGHNNNTGTNSSSKKRKGGWPKGKVRKFSNDALRPPKPPVTGYQAFAKRRREELMPLNPQVPFHEISARIGHEWSSLTEEEQRPFMEEAAADRERYKRELEEFKQSDAFQIYLRDKSSDGAKASGGRLLSHQKCEKSASGPCVDELTDLLACTLCNMYFSSTHNKAEHLRGREHQSRLYEKLDRVSCCTDTQHCATGNTLQSPLGGAGAKKNEEPLNLDDFVTGFVHKNAEREMELQVLSEHIEGLRAKKSQLIESLRQIRDRECRLQQQKMNMELALVKSERQLETLRTFENSFQSTPVYVLTLSTALEEL